MYNKEYRKKYYLKNKEKINKANLSYNKNNPWTRILYSIKQRCTNKNNKKYRYYGGKWIRCYITKDEIKEIWFRDNAASMKHPSIDRIDPDGNYEFSNCRFIELEENSSRANLGIKKVKHYDMRHGIITKV